MSAAPEKKKLKHVTLPCKYAEKDGAFTHTYIKMFLSQEEVKEDCIDYVLREFFYASFSIFGRILVIIIGQNHTF